MIIVVVIDTVYLFNTRSSVAKMQQDMSANNTLLDLNEFKDLNPEFKDNYKRLVVGNLMPVVNAKANEMIEAHKVNTYIKKNEDDILAGIADFKNMPFPSSESTSESPTEKDNDNSK
jgi:hypothetical protein